MQPLTKFEKSIATILIISAALGLLIAVKLTLDAFGASMSFQDGLWIGLVLVIIASLGLLSGVALLKTQKRGFWRGAFIFYLVQIVSVPDDFYFRATLISVRLNYGDASVDLVALALAVFCIFAYVRKPNEVMSIQPEAG